MDAAAGFAGGADPAVDGQTLVYEEDGQLRSPGLQLQSRKDAGGSGADDDDIIAGHRRFSLRLDWV